MKGYLEGMMNSPEIVALCIGMQGATIAPPSEVNHVSEHEMRLFPLVMTPEASIS
ncbi:MAG: hypothetical protein ACFUZC_12155 [Chthoniobacteraceae bacterium]